MGTRGFAGVLVPVLTPFHDGLAPDRRRWVALCRALLDAGADGLAVFGTTSEANSLTAAERRDLLEHLISAGVPAERLMAGVGSCALPEAVGNARHALANRCGGVLMLPPWYYKNPSDDGLFAFYAETVERVGDAALRIYLYHFPAMSQVPLSLGLIERLIAAYPDTIVGIKDSGGDWANTQAMIERFPGFDVFCGSEEFLLATLRHGGRGCITAVGNVNVHAINTLYLAWRNGDGAAGKALSRHRADADAQQERVSAIRALFTRGPTIPLLKAVLARHTGDPGWTHVRPPFCPADAAAAERLDSELRAAGYDPGPLFDSLR